MQVVQESGQVYLEVGVQVTLREAALLERLMVYQQMRAAQAKNNIRVGEGEPIPPAWEVLAGKVLAAIHEARVERIPGVPEPHP